MHWRRGRLGDPARRKPSRADHIGHAARMHSDQRQGMSKVYWTKDNVTGATRTTGSFSAVPGQHAQDLDELPQQTMPSFTSRHPVSMSFFTPRHVDVAYLQKFLPLLIILGNL